MSGLLSIYRDSPILTALGITIEARNTTYENTKADLYILDDVHHYVFRSARAKVLENPSVETLCSGMTVDIRLMKCFME